MGASGDTISSGRWLLMLRALNVACPTGFSGTERTGWNHARIANEERAVTGPHGSHPVPLKQECPTLREE